MEDENEAEDEDCLLVTPLDQILVHKPNEMKPNAFSGYIPFQLEVSVISNLD